MIRPRTSGAIPGQPRSDRDRSLNQNPAGRHRPTAETADTADTADERTLLAAAEHIWSDTPAQVGHTLRALTSRARATNDRALLAAALTLNGHAALRRGRVIDAITHLERAFSLPRIGWSARMPSPEAGLVDAYVARGELDHAMALRGPLAVVAEGDDLAAATAVAAEASLAGAQGDHEQAAARFADAGRVAAASDQDTPSRLAWRSGVALALTRLGRVDEARQFAADELHAARLDGSAYAIAQALRTHATLTTGPQQEQALRTALDSAHSAEAPRLAAQIATDLAAILTFPNGDTSRDEQMTEAADLLRSAQPHALSQGMLPLQRRITRLHLLLGEHAQADAESPHLTRSEHRVATMATTGLSNQEIAGRLVVTVKAVEWHLSNVYRKLGIRGRPELGVALAAPDRQDGVPPPPSEGPRK